MDGMQDGESMDVSASGGIVSPDDGPGVIVVSRVRVAVVD